MDQQSTLPGLPETAPRPSGSPQLRDRLAARCQRVDLAYPKALDLEAAVLEAMHGELHGVASQLSGPHAEDNWRERLRGERSMHLQDLCRLATEPTREARQAMVAALDVLERAVGRVPVPIVGRATGSLAGSAGNHAAAATELLAAVARALEDGTVDATERSSIRVMVAAARKTLSAVEAHLLDERGNSPC